MVESIIDFLIEIPVICLIGLMYGVAFLLLPLAQWIDYKRDVRKYGKVIPLGFKVMECFLKVGFSSKEIIIKEQHNCKSTEYWENRDNNFLLLAHEYIFVFQKV